MTTNASKADRTINLGVELTHNQVVDNTNREAAGVYAAHKIKDAVPNFTPVKEYTTFDAEYALIAGDIVIHFFTTKEMQRLNQMSEGGPVVLRYWKLTFPEVLDSTSKKYFNADKPRLRAAYTEEMASWWFKAQSYDHLIDVDGFVLGFFEALDRDLERLETQLGS